MDFLKEVKLKNIFLGVREGNINAIRLYEKHGFKKVIAILYLILQIFL